MLQRLKSLSTLRLLRIASGVAFLIAAFADKEPVLALLAAGLLAQGLFNLSCFFIPNQTCAGTPLAQQEHGKASADPIVFEEIKAK